MRKDKQNCYFVNFVGHGINILDHNGEKLLGMSVDHRGRKAVIGSVFQTRRGAFIPNSNVMVKTITTRVALELPNGEQEEFPAPREGTVYIVPVAALKVLQYDYGRQDVFAPGPLLRNSMGAIGGCAGLARFPEVE